MARRKTTKEYAIRLIHPELGEYYFNYMNTGNYYSSKQIPEYVFTQTLKKVNTWKTKNVVEKFVKDIVSTVNGKKRKIYIPLGKELDENLSREIKSKIVCIKKRFYFSIENIFTDSEVVRLKEENEKIHSAIVIDSKFIKKKIKEEDFTSEDFLIVLNKFNNSIKRYNKNTNTLNTTLLEGRIDIVNASYGFRYLKLKNLKSIEPEDETETELELEN